MVKHTFNPSTKNAEICLVYLGREFQVSQGCSETLSQKKEKKKKEKTESLIQDCQL